MTKYIYIKDDEVFKIFIDGLIEGFQPIRIFEDERLADMWCRDMNLSYRIGWEHGIQEQIEKDDDEFIYLKENTDDNEQEATEKN